MTHDSKGKFTSLKSKIRTFHRRFIIGTKVATLSILMVGTVLAIFNIVTSHTTYTQTVYAATEAAAVQEIPQVLKNVGDCESGNGKKDTRSQFDKKGLPVEHVNMTGKYAGTIDVGELGINKTFWGAKAVELGYDIYTQEGNEAMGRWLVDHYGTEPWHYTSGSCWAK